MTTATDRPDSSDSSVGAGDFTRTKTFTAAPEAVLQALRTTDGIAGWWGDTVGSAGAGGTFEVGFGSDRSITITAAAIETSRVEWHVVRAPHTPEWDGTLIVFELAPVGGGTEMRFTHHGLTPQLECFDMCNQGWTHYLASLVDFVDRGAGQPYRHGRVRGHDDDGS